MSYAETPEVAEKIQTHLATFDQTFEAVQMEDSLVLPDNSYEVVIDNARLFYSKYDQLTLLWRLTVQKPLAYSNYPIRRYSRIATPSNIKWLKQDLSRCGLELKRLSDLPHYLDNLHGVQLAITKRTKDGYENIYFNRRIRNIPEAKNEPKDFSQTLEILEEESIDASDASDLIYESEEDIPF
jgi:hypothetical protein